VLRYWRHSKYLLLLLFVTALVFACLYTGCLP
jgi:hypothetical protein